MTLVLLASAPKQCGTIASSSSGASYGFRRVLLLHTGRETKRWHVVQRNGCAEIKVRRQKMKWNWNHSEVCFEQVRNQFFLRRHCQHRDIDKFACRHRPNVPDSNCAAYTHIDTGTVTGFLLCSIVLCVVYRKTYPIFRAISSNSKMRMNIYIEQDVWIESKKECRIEPKIIVVICRRIWLTSTAFHFSLSSFSSRTRSIQ